MEHQPPVRFVLHSDVLHKASITVRSYTGPLHRVGVSGTGTKRVLERLNDIIRGHFRVSFNDSWMNPNPHSTPAH